MFRLEKKITLFLICIS